MGQVFLNLGSGNFKFHDEMSKQGSALSMQCVLTQEMKEVILEDSMWRCEMDPNHNNLQMFS